MEINKFYSLQILRAFAAWLVVFHHYMQSYYNFETESLVGTILSYRGNFGVDLFFVLSGFIMFLVTQNKTSTAPSFFIKRVFRVVPAYWFYTSVLIVLITFFPTSFAFTDYNGESLLYSYLFIPSLNPSGIGLYPTLTVGWTLIFEIVFYTILTVSILLSKKYFIFICIFLIGVSPELYPKGNLYSPILGSFQIWQFLFGFFIGLYLQSSLYKKINALVPPTIQALLFLFISIVLLSGKLGYGLTHKTIAASLIVMAFILLETKISYSGSITKLLLKSGDYSYSIYLSHILIINVLLHFTGNQLNFIQETGVIFLLVILVYSISAFSYKYIENNSSIKKLRKKLLTTVTSSAPPPIYSDKKINS